MIGSPIRPISEVKISSVPTPVSLKNFSTRYLSMCVEIAHSTGPQKASAIQLMRDARG
jgi:hypothetical protein